MWQKQGFIFKPSSDNDWSITHAQVPFPIKLPGNQIRIFFATRDAESRSSVSFIDVDANNPHRILKVNEKPCLQKGKAGYFDDSGTMPSWIVENEGKLLLYYTAWNKSATASYRLSIGIAESNDMGLTFKKMFEGPIMDRAQHDPIWVGQPCVLKEGDLWRMWYLSCQKIEYVNGHPEPFYNVKYAESSDGISWDRKNLVCIDFETDSIDAIGRPFVFKENGIYKMYHSNRSAIGYREQKDKAYRIGYSESTDGVNWIRLDDRSGIEKGSEGEWDSIMQEYCAIYFHEDNKYMFYNGNGFGATGFGLAVSK